MRETSYQFITKNSQQPKAYRGGEKKVMKKSLSLLLAIALVFGMFANLASAAEMTVGEKLQAAGIIKGTGAGLDEDKLWDREDVTVIISRLLDAEAEAKATEKNHTFADVSNPFYDGYITWAQENGYFNGKSETKFGFDQPIKVKEFAAVMLRVLGVDADYSEVEELAVEFGLVEEGADFANPAKRGYFFTVLDNTLLVEDEDGVTLGAALGLKGYVPEVVVTELKVSDVEGYTNTKVAVSLSEAAKVVVASDFSVKDSAGAAVEVKGATLSTDGKVVYVETAAQTAFAKYTLTAQGTSYEYVAVAADTDKPVIDSVTIDASAVVTVDFNEKVDAASAGNVGNYTISPALTVISATVDGDKVTLVTSKQTAGTLYSLTVQNVADIAGNVMDKKENLYFGGVVDEQKPVVSSVTVDASAVVTVDFNENVDAASAGNVGNYSTDPALTILTATVDGDKVYLVTSKQTVGALYNLTVQNVADKNGNVMDKKDGLYFGGVVDEQKPVVSSVTVDSNAVVVVDFNENVDKASAENVGNYATSPELTILKASVDGDKVYLTTSKQTIGALYNLTVQNVADKNGNVMDKKDGLYFGGVVDEAGPTISTVTASAKQLVITFNEALDKTLAEKEVNYSFDGGLSYPSKAVYDAAAKTVTLTTAAHTPGKIYTVTVNGLKDVNGNAITANTKRTFAGVGTVAGATQVKIQAIIPVNVNTIDIHFNGEPTVGTLTIDTAVNAVTTNHATADTYAVKLENKNILRVQFKSGATANPTLFEAGKIYTLTVDNTDITNLHADAGSGVKVFSGNGVANTIPAIATVVPVNSTAVKVIFTEPVTGVNAADFDINNTTTPGALTIAGDQLNDATAVVSEVILNLTTPLVQGNVYELVLDAATNITDAATFNAIKLDSKATFGGNNVANAAPKVQAVVVKDKWNFDIIFSEDVLNAAAAANFQLLEGATDMTATNITGQTFTADGNKVSVALNSATATALESGKVYKLVVTNAGKLAITDKQLLAYDAATGADSVQFGANNADNAQPVIASVDADAATDTIVVKFSEKVNINTTFDLLFSLTIDGAAVTLQNDAIVVANGDTVTIALDGTNGTLNFAAGKTGSINVITGSLVKDSNNQNAKTDAVSFGTR